MSNGYLVDSGLNRDSLVDALDRITVLEAAVAALQTAPRVVAYLKGTLTGGGLVTSFTTLESENLSISTLGVTAINFSFGTARPTANYAVAFINASGTTTLDDSAVTGESVSGFSVTTFTAGVNVNPRTTVADFTVAVFQKN